MLRANLAYRPGLEPGFSVLETDVLPLDDRYKMVGMSGVEPPISPSQGERVTTSLHSVIWYTELDSNQHCHASKARASCRWATGASGAGCQTRTDNHRVLSTIALPISTTQLEFFGFSSLNISCYKTGRHFFACPACVESLLPLVEIPYCTQDKYNQSSVPA